MGSRFFSDDGETWESSPSFTSSPFSDVSIYDLDAVVHGDHIYAFQSQHVWRSPDGYNWTELEGNTDSLEAASIDNNITMASFGGYLWLGGIFIGLEASGDGMVWRSVDGASWTRIFSDPVVDAIGPAMTQFGDYLLFTGSSSLLATKATCQELLGAPQSVDASGCGTIELGELLRIVQFFSYGTFHCDPTSEDGYAPGPAPEGEGAVEGAAEGEPAPCLPHTTDFAPYDWRITLNELLRLIQIYNADSYIQCPIGTVSEDGYCIP